MLERTTLEGRNRKRMRGTAGFTLLEMMLVVVIIGLLATVVIINIGGQSDIALTEATKAKMSQVKTALSQYYSKNGSYPASLAPLYTGTAPLLEKEPLDGWKHRMFYLTPGQEQGKDYTLISAGKDGKMQTQDDISIWNMDEK